MDDKIKDLFISMCKHDSEWLDELVTDPRLMSDFSGSVVEPLPALPAPLMSVLNSKVSGVMHSNYDKCRKALEDTSQCLDPKFKYYLSHLLRYDTNWLGAFDSNTINDNTQAIEQGLREIEDIPEC